MLPKLRKHRVQHAVLVDLHRAGWRLAFANGTPGQCRYRTADGGTDMAMSSGECKLTWEHHSARSNLTEKVQ